MRRVLMGVFGLAALLSPVSAAAQAWELVWSDEFDGTSIDTGKWRLEDAAQIANQELHYTTPQAVSVSGGMATILAEKRPFMGREYTGGQIDTRGKFAFRYGRAEARLRLPRGKGLWTAFWTLPADGRWPPEFDIMESIGVPTTVYHTLHWGAACPLHAYDGNPTSGPDYSSQFGVFTLEWFPGRVDWYVDGVLRRSVTTNVPDMPMELILGVGVGGTWPGPPDASTVFPQRYEIDYVRVYKRADLPPEEPLPAGFQNGGFEVCGGPYYVNNVAMGRPFWYWLNSGNVYDDTATKRSGTRAVKMFGRYVQPSSLSSLTQMHPTPIPPLAKVRMSGFVRHNAGQPVLPGTSLSARVTFFSAAGVQVGLSELVVLTPSSPMDQWRAFTLTSDTAPDGAATASAQLRFNQTGFVDGAAYIDDVSFAVLPCRGDFTGDGVFSPADVFAFLAAFFARDIARCDVDGNGFLEPQDVFAFLSAYFARCR